MIHSYRFYIQNILLVKVLSQKGEKFPHQSHECTYRAFLRDTSSQA